MTSRTGSASIRNRRGVTLVEMIVAMTISLVILGSTTSLFIMLQRISEREQHVGQLRSDLHIASDRLSGWIRNGDGVDQASTSSRLLISGGQSEALCGAATCWVEVGDTGLESGPLGDAEPPHTIARTVTELTLTYGLDDDADGSVDSFAAAIPAGRAADVLAVNIGLALNSGSGEAGFETGVEFVTVLRAPVFARLPLIQ